jgi:hypothetical protein
MSEYDESDADHRLAPETLAKATNDPADAFHRLHLEEWQRRTLDAEIASAQERRVERGRVVAYARTTADEAEADPSAWPEMSRDPVYMKGVVDALRAVANAIERGDHVE